MLEWISEERWGCDSLRFGWIGIQVDVGDIEDVVFGGGAILFAGVRTYARSCRECFDGGEDVLSAGSCRGH